MLMLEMNKIKPQKHNTKALKALKKKLKIIGII